MTTGLRYVCWNLTDFHADLALFWLEMLFPTSNPAELEREQFATELASQTLDCALATEMCPCLFTKT